MPKLGREAMGRKGLHYYIVELIRDEIVKEKIGVKADNEEHAKDLAIEGEGETLESETIQCDTTVESVTEG